MTGPSSTSVNLKWIAAVCRVAQRFPAFLVADAVSLP